MKQWPGRQRLPKMEVIERAADAHPASPTTPSFRRSTSGMGDEGGEVISLRPDERRVLPRDTRASLLKTLQTRKLTESEGASRVPGVSGRASREAVHSTVLRTLNSATPGLENVAERLSTLEGTQPSGAVALPTTAAALLGLPDSEATSLSDVVQALQDSLHVFDDGYRQELLRRVQTGTANASMKLTTAADQALVEKVLALRAEADQAMRAVDGLVRIRQRVAVYEPLLACAAQHQAAIATATDQLQLTARTVDSVAKQLGQLQLTANVNREGITHATEQLEDRIAAVETAEIRFNIPRA